MLKGMRVGFTAWSGSGARRRRLVRTTLVMLVLAALLVAAGCASQAPAPAAPTPAPAQPAAEAPKAEAPKAEAPKAEAPKAEEKDEPIELRFATASVGGSWYATGGAIAEVVKSLYPHINITVGPGGSLANAKALQEDKTDLALVFTTTLADVTKAGTAANLKQVANLFPVFMQTAIYRDSGIKSYEDLKGKRAATVQKGTGSEQMFADVLKVHGVTYDDLKQIQHSTVADGTDLLKDGHIDAFGILTAVPGAHVLDGGAVRPLLVLGVPKEKHAAMQAINSGYIPAVIPAGTYAAQGHPEAIDTMRTVTLLVAHPRVPERVMYQIAKAIADNAERLAATVGDFKGKTSKDFGENLGFEFHPGAVRFYKEAGVQ